MLLRRRKQFPSDIKGIGVQRDLSMYQRIGMITQVFPEQGLCNIRWLDKPGVRLDVILTQGAHKEWSIPEKGAVVLVAFDHHERARIVRYINVGHEDRVREIKSLPRFKEGDKFWEVGGSFLYMKSNGDIILSTANQGYFTLENSTGTFKSESVNWKVVTEATTVYSGIIKRFTSNTDGSKSIEEITRLSGDNLTEFRFKLVETADGTLGITGITDPLVDICVGTFVNDDGDIVAKNEQVTTDTTKELVIRIALKSGVKLFIDKDGRVSIEGAKININKAKVDTDDPDVNKGLETASTSGDKGQHVAREHDNVTVPISNDFQDSDHTELHNISQENITALTTLAAAIISPSGPCSLNPTLLTDTSLKLKGIITSGAENVLVGDN